MCNIENGPKVTFVAPHASDGVSASGYMLGRLGYLAVPTRKGGDNLTSADNQQERLIAIGWIVGFVDGEGCFSVSINRNHLVSTGWQVLPEFVVTQGERSLSSLEALQDFFGCGNIFVNRRYDNHKEPLYRYCVRARSELWGIIVPFFEANPLRTSKQEDFRKFVQVLHLMEQGKHLTLEGIAEIAEIAQTMNRRKPSRFLRILRDYTPDIS